MRRTLKRGATYKAKDGIVYGIDRDGNPFRATQKRIDPHVDGKGNPLPLEFDITDAEFSKNPGIWVPTPEETAIAKEKHLEAEKKWHEIRGKEMPAGLVEVIMGKAKAENKMVEPEEPKRGPGRPPKVAVKA